MTHYIENTNGLNGGFKSGFNGAFTEQGMRYALPLPPASITEQRDEMAVYARFMRHLRHVPAQRMEIKILSAIQFTADMMDLSDAHVAKVLVDLGLRAPRIAFPADFLGFIDQALQRSSLDVGAPNLAMSDLKSFWDGIGEDRFSGFKTGFGLLSSSGYHA